jgi:SAM-dependent methyltransferase
LSITDRIFATGAERKRQVACAPVPACAACGSARLVPHFRVAGEIGEPGLIPTTDRYGTALGDIVRCTGCTHMQLDRFPAAAELADAYGRAESRDYVDEEAGQRETARRILDRIESVADRGAMLDLGCWVGFLLAEARERGWRTLGVEPSEFASRYASEELGLEVVHADLERADLPPASFHAAFLGDVIEHLPDAAGTLDRVAAALAPAGVVALALPDAGSRLARAIGRRWWAIVPTHVHYFTRRSLGTLLVRTGFEPISFATAPKAFTVRYYLRRLGGYSEPLARALVAAAEAVGLAERMWAPDFGDRMLVLARAPAGAKAPR